MAQGRIQEFNVGGAWADGERLTRAYIGRLPGEQLNLNVIFDQASGGGAPSWVQGQSPW